MSGPDSGQFRALQGEVADLRTKVDTLAAGLVAVLDATGMPAPPESRPGLRVIKGGQS